jgi:predicted AlkP superfamily phosphohydrolase/phosphomutase
MLALASRAFSRRARIAPVALALGIAGGCSDPARDVSVIVLGFDGMDPKFIERHKDVLPNLQRLADQGGFSELETVMPPQSPVAWSTVITGLMPGGHGVFDFVHRDPYDMSPFSSMAEAIPPEYTLEIGDWVIPLDAGETVPLRRGKAFWEVLAENNVPSTMMKMPTDFPPLPAEGGAVSGMGTPDMLGSFGTFQFFTDDPDEFVLGEVSGGEINRVDVIQNHVEAEILGPVNSFLAEEPRTEARVSVDVDPISRAARIEIEDDVLVLKEGDWSEWVHIDFELIPYALSASGMVRLYLKEVHPHFKLYVSPVQIDPTAPEVQISWPDDYAAELAEAGGPFYTQGMAEETKGLSAHVLTRPEFVEQSNIVYDEEIALYEHLLGQYRGGLMFYYFSTTDQAAHMLWGDYEEMLVPIYEKADAVVGHTLDTIDDDTELIIISDHGFARFDREVHLNRWLMDEGFLTLDDPENVGGDLGFVHVDWEETTAYAMGLNGLYLNLEGREDGGIVAEAEVAELKKKITNRLLKFTDPESGKPVVERVYDPSEEFEGEEMEYAPDLLVGFAPGYRMSPATGLGAVPHVAINDNPDEWIGDHCMAHENVPGVLFSNRPITGDKPRLHDIPVTVLTAFGVTPPADMVGQNVIDHSK